MTRKVQSKLTRLAQTASKLAGDACDENRVTIFFLVSLKPVLSLYKSMFITSVVMFSGQ